MSTAVVLIYVAVQSLETAQLFLILVKPELRSSGMEPGDDGGHGDTTCRLIKSKDFTYYPQYLSSIAL